MVGYSMNNWANMPEGKSKYQAYLASREWGAIKQQVYARSGGICERCRHNPGESVHHLTYERKYREHIDDLRHVCTPCHEYEHGIRKDDPRLSVPIERPVWPERPIGIGIYPASVCALVDIGHTDSGRYLVVGYELLGSRRDDGHPYVAVEKIQFLMHGSAILCSRIGEITGRKPLDCEPFDPWVMLGKECEVFIGDTFFRHQLKVRGSSSAGIQGVIRPVAYSVSRPTVPFPDFAFMGRIYGRTILDQIRSSREACSGLVPGLPRSEAPQ